MKPFRYLAPRSLDEAVRLLREHGPDARVLAGGQTLLLAMKDRTATPAVLVSLAEVPDLTGATETADGLEIGATTTYAQLVAADFRGWYGEVSAVAGDLADRPVRNLGTLGGALCSGEPRFDMPALMVGVDATVELASVDGTRPLPAAEFLSPTGGTAARADEILTRVRLPEPGRYTAVAFEKVRYRVFDAALASVTCAVRLDDDGTVAAARLVVGAATPAPVVATAADQLAGRPLADVDLAALGAAVADEVLGADPGPNRLRRYQREVLPALVRRAVARVSTVRPALAGTAS